MIHTNNKSKYSNDFLKWLGIPEKYYSTDEIKQILLNRYGTNHKGYLQLDDQAKVMLDNNTSMIRIQTALTIIKHKYIIINYKPTCDFFEYNQSPIEVKHLIL